MMNQDELLENEIGLARRFFETQAKNDHCYFKLYTVPYADSKYTRHDLRAKNFDTDTMGQSLERLKDEMINQGDRCKRFFVLKHFSVFNDPQPVEIVLKNPFFDASAQKGYNPAKHSSINGFGMNGLDGNLLYQLLTDKAKEREELKDKIKDLEHQRDLDEMDARVRELEQGQRTGFDAIMDFIQGDTGQTIVSGLMAMFVEKQNASPTQLHSSENIAKDTARPEPQIKNEEPDQQTDQLKEHHQNARILSDALVRLDGVFGVGEGLNALQELAIWAQNNPGLAKNLRNSQLQGNGE